MRLTLVSDTHTKHNELDLPGGDILIHAGDLMNSGYNKYDIEFFCKWLSEQPYKHKVFIAGNHDRIFQNDWLQAKKYIDAHDIIYLCDSEVVIDGIKIYGSPWQPEFCSWAFNLPRDGEELKSKWDATPKDTDILITHGPPLDILDISGAPYNTPKIGCSLLRRRVDLYPPKIHVFGHIHGGYGYEFHNGTHFFNASVLNEKYEYANEPVTIDWNKVDNTL